MFTASDAAASGAKASGRADGGAAAGDAAASGSRASSLRNKRPLSYSGTAPFAVSYTHLTLPTNREV